MLGLVLVGGLSERMGQPKALLEYDGVPLYRRAYELLSKVCSAVYLSARENQRFDLPTIYDGEFKDIGPASGLLSAYKLHRDTWFVLACDFPLATEEAVSQLAQAYSPPATYFTSNSQIEPLFAIWSPEALDALKENVWKGRTGPIYTLKSLGGKGVEPRDVNWLYNTNIPEEWNGILNGIARKTD